MKRLIASLALCLSVAAETLTFQWEVFPDTNYTGYVLDMTKVPLAAGVTNRSQHPSWALTVVVPGRTTSGTVITIAPAQFVGTNWFYLTATGPSAGTNVVAPTDMSAPVVAFKGTNRPANFRMGSVEIQSTTNLTALINWQTESIMPVEYDLAATNKFYRAKLAISQGAPIMPWLSTPPAPGP